MDCELLGWPPAGPQLQLDYRQFSYAGKFVMTNTGKAVVRDSDITTDVDSEPVSEDSATAPSDDADTATDIVAAVAFNEDRTESATLWLRYITVRTDRRGEGIGPRLVRFVRDRALQRGYDRLRIAVNNPFAYQALSKAGFGYTGETTGIAELVLECPADVTTAQYHDGLRVFRDRDLTEAEQTFLEDCLGSSPPEINGYN